MKRIIRLTESDLSRIVKRVINEQDDKCMDEYGYEVPCKHDGTDIPYNVKDLPEISVTAVGPKKIYTIKLKKPTSDGYMMLTYDIRTGELMGDGKKENVIAKIQPNQSEYQVNQWLNKNRFKVVR